MEHSNLSVENITAGLWSRIAKHPDDVVYTLTWEDIVSVLAQEMAAEGVPLEAFTQDELEQLLESGRDVNLPWQETLEILFMLDWPEPCRFETHGTKAEGDIFTTTTLMWECECADRYLHPRSQECCLVCKAHREDSPDARLSEIWPHAIEISPALLTYLKESFQAFSDEQDE